MFCSRSTLRGACLLVALGCLALAAPAQAQEAKAKAKAAPKKIPEPEELDLTTADGVDLKATYYPGLRAKDSIPVILLHMFKGSRLDYEVLATRLQRAGHAVIVPDLRGHGDSTQVRNAGRDYSEINPMSLKTADFTNMYLRDVEAVKSFLMDENNAGRLNIEKLCVVGAEMGAVVALNWAAWDWHWPQLPSQKQGQDVKALVLISPQYAFKGLKVAPALANDNVRKLSFLISVGKQDATFNRDAKRIHGMLERFHPLPEEKERQALQDLFFAPLATSLQGTKILDEKSLGLDDAIVQFIELRLLKKPFPWTDRTSVLD